jgi:hypothetical protein
MGEEIAEIAIPAMAATVNHTFHRPLREVQILETTRP